MKPDARSPKLEIRNLKPEKEEKTDTAALYQVNSVEVKQIIAAVLPEEERDAYQVRVSDTYIHTSING